MKTRIADLVVKSVAVAGLAAVLAFGGGFDGTNAQQADADNYFVVHPGTLSGQTGIDPYDPYAPVDLGSAGGDSQRQAGVAADVVTAAGGASEHCVPQRCRAW